jgi:hypothetical protein
MAERKRSYLEIKGAEERHNELVRSDYNTSDAYSESHEDALSDPNNKDKPLGKGTNNGGHQHYTPDYTKPQTLFNYGNFDTTNGGGSYDIHGRNGISGRNRLVKINIYNQDNSYSMNSVDTSANIAEGQYVFKG